MARITIAKETGTPSAPPSGYSRLYAEGTSIKYIDDTGTIYTLASGINPEDVQDIVGAMCVDSASIDFTYNDGANTLSAALTSTGVTPGSYGSATEISTFTVDSQGRITAAGSVTVTPAWASITGKPTTLAGYGITDAQPLDGDLSAIANLLGTGFITRTAANTVTTRALSAGTGISVTNGDGISGAPSIAISNTSVSPGSYGSASNIGTFTVDAQGRLTAAASAPIQIVQSQVTGLTADLAGKQPLDADLSALAGLAGTGIAVRTSADTWAQRAIAAGTGINVANGSGTAANPSISLSDTSVTPGTYGSSTDIPVLTIDQQGRVTSASVQVVPGVSWNEAAIAADITNSSNTAFVTLSGLQFSVIAGRRYRVELMLMFRSAAATAGLRLTINTLDTAAISNMAFHVGMPIAADGTAAQYNGTINALNDIVTSTAVPTVNANFIAQAAGIIIPSASGILAFQFASEVNGTTVTVAAGSNILVREFA